MSRTTTLDHFEKEAFDILERVLLRSTIRAGCGPHLIERKMARVEMSDAFAALLLKQYRAIPTLAQAPPEIWLLAGRIAGAELNLRNDYRQLGAGHPETIKAWNKLRDAGNAIRQIEDHVWDAAPLSVPSTDSQCEVGK